MPATYRRTSSAWKTLRGNTTVNNLRTCETVSAGAFFFQPELEMPEKEVGQHTREHVMMPAGVFAHFIVGHAQLGFRFLKTLFNGPPDPTEPHKETQGNTHRSVAQVVPVARMGAKRALDEQPHSCRGVPFLAQHNPFAGEFVGYRAFGPFRYSAAIPERRWDRVGHLGDGARRGGRHRHAPCAWLLLVCIGLRGGRQRLEPPPRVRWRRHKRDGA